MRANGCELSHVCEANEKLLFAASFFGRTIPTKEPSLRPPPHSTAWHSKRSFWGEQHGQTLQGSQSLAGAEGSTGLSGGQSKELHLFGSAMDPTLTHLMAPPCGIGHLSHLWITKSGNQSNTI